MQGNIHLNQFRARVKSNRSGGEDDLTLAIDHFRVFKLTMYKLRNRKIYCFIRTDGIHGTLLARHTPWNPKVHWAGPLIALNEIAKPSLDTNEYVPRFQFD